MGHKLIGDGDGEHVGCLVCGAVYRDGENGPEASNGDRANYCTGDTSQGHGDPREHGDDADDLRYRHDCNCVVCA